MLKKKTDKIVDDWEREKSVICEEQHISLAY